MHGMFSLFKVRHTVLIQLSPIFWKEESATHQRKRTGKLSQIVMGRLPLQGMLMKWVFLSWQSVRAIQCVCLFFFNQDYFFQKTSTTPQIKFSRNSEERQRLLNQRKAQMLENARRWKKKKNKFHAIYNTVITNVMNVQSSPIYWNCMITGIIQ